MNDVESVTTRRGSRFSTTESVFRGRERSDMRCRGTDAGEHHVNDALRVHQGEGSYAAVDDQAYRAGKHLAEEDAVDRWQLAPADGEVHPPLRVCSALLEDVGDRLPNRGVFSGGLHRQFERPAERRVQAPARAIR